MRSVAEAGSQVISGFLFAAIRLIMRDINQLDREFLVRSRGMDLRLLSGMSTRYGILAMAALVTGISMSARAESPVSKSADSALETLTSQSETSVPLAILQMPPVSNFYSPYAFVVDKKARTLSVWHSTAAGLKRVAQFPADLGKATGDKLRRNDHKTPEGIYFLLERHEGASLDFKLYGKRAFTTDYPNFFDRLEGKTGDGIWLHAVPDETPLTRGSRGCVVVRNDVILDLTQYVKLGRTPILIQNSTEFVEAKDHGRATNELAHWLENWRAAWESKNVDSYIQHYANDFRSNNMNREQWRRYKQRLTSAYKSIKVNLSRPAIFSDRNRAVVRFIQEYQSDRHGDMGEKVLYLRKTNEGYRIVGEVWSEESSQLARQEIEAARGNQVLGCSPDKAGDCVRTSAATTAQ